MKNLFIDTNVFLSFFHLTSEDLEELKKLGALIDNAEIQLFLPAQVENEFVRNRGAKIVDAMRTLREAKFTLSFPLFAKDYPEYESLRELIKNAGTLHASLMKKITDDVECEELNADKIVAALFSKAKKIAVTDDLIYRAVTRVRLGNPPGKEGSMGDAVNWESLLATVPNGEEIFVVSGDRDFRSKLSDNEVNEFLDKEWSEKKNSTLVFYSKISDFFKVNFPNIKIASEVERDLLIQKLANSGSFATTHALVAKLSAQPDFSTAQVEQLVDIAKSNNQVAWIVGDSDVHAFYSGLIEKYGKSIQEDAAVKLADIVQEGIAFASNDDEPGF